MIFIAKRVGVLVFLLILSRGGAWCAESAFQTARQFQAEGNYPAAERLYREFLREEPSSVPALANLGIVLARQGKFGDAVNAYRTALSIDPGALPVKVDLALAYYRMNDWKEAIVAFQAVLDADPNDQRSLQLLAISYSQGGQFSQAAATYQKLLPSSDPAVSIGLATAYRELGRLQESEDVLRSTLAQHPDAPEVRFLLGLAQYARGD